jgi:hypothetical protein
MRIAWPGWKAEQLPHLEVRTQALAFMQKLSD